MNDDPSPSPADTGTATAQQPGAAPENRAELPLFPLQMVLFPGGLLQLKVFEARYLDLMSHCLRNQAPFGVVCLSEGAEVRRGGRDKPGDKAADKVADKARFESVAVLAHLQELDSDHAGILRARCLGGQRVRLGVARQRADGLWLAPAEPCADDEASAVSADLQQAADALGQAIGALAAQDQTPFARPYQLDDAGWVANRWCEILPISLAAKYRLMVLDEPLLRLKLVDEFLRGKGVV